MSDLHCQDGVLLGFDYGSRNIGVAVGQKITSSASILSPLITKNNILPWDKIDELIRQWLPCGLVVGIPYTYEGLPFKITASAKKFMNQLGYRYKLPVYAAEEGLTTKFAKKEIFEKGGVRALLSKSIDSYAAKLILEGWMRQRTSENSSDDDARLSYSCTDSLLFKD